MICYEKIDLKNYDLDNEFKDFITEYQNIYKNKIVKNISDPLEVKDDTTLEKKDIKSILEDFFFTPRYDNVLDLLKFGTSETTEN